MPKHTFTNTTKGPKGVVTSDGQTVYVEPGATSVELDVFDGDLKGLKDADWFELDASKAKQEKAREAAEEPAPAPAADGKKQ